jgi:cytochrome oxidase Cu insertion factor (SCO1/SenC/PrrC family)
MTRILAKTILLIIAACMMYVTNLGVQTPRARPVGIGEMAPDFTLEDHHGRKMTLAESLGKSPVVLVFYRGYW